MTPALAQVAGIFTAPALAAAGAAAVSIPVAIHLLSRMRRKPQPWAAMRFLEMALRRQRNRLRLEQWLLLATRCLIMLVAALALAGPVLGGCAGRLSGALDPGGRVLVLVIDDGLSASAQQVAGAGDATRLDAAKSQGLGLLDALSRGDRVAGCVPNMPETVIAMLAVTSLGAVWSSCSPDFGVQGVLDRFGQIAPKVLFVTDGYRYNGRVFDMRDTVAGILGQLPDVQTCVVVPFVEDEPAIEAVPRGVHYAEFMQDADTIEFARLPFDHPLYIMYSSGTTGTPKCIVHGAGGTLIQQMKEHVLHVDLKPGDHLFYFTTCGWMMWNWLVAGLACGATLVLYDGSPFHPDGGRLWRMAEQERINVFGTSAKYIAALEKAGLHPGRDHDLSALRTVLSTGSPLAPASFDYVYREIADDVLLASISGGTDILGCFAGGCPIRPVWRGELQCRMLGMAVDVWDEDGTPLVGEKGELVCTKPFPSMPIGFWNDESGEKYREAYFTRFPGVWAHGDFAELTEHDGMIIHGRSDAVLNPGGVRIGTAEIYRQVEKIDDVLESIAIGQDLDDDVRVVLFVVLRPGVELDEALESRIRRVIRENATPRHVPAKILAVPDIPRTISGKITELAVRSVVHGETVKNTDALANPEALEYFRDRPELAES